APHRIGDAEHDNGDRAGRLLGGQSRWRNRHQQDVHWEADQLGCEVREALVLPGRPAGLHDEVLAFDVAECTHPLEERFQHSVWSARFWSGITREHTNPVHVRWLLRLGCERRYADASESEGDDAPDDGASHSSLLTSVPWMA